MANTKQATKRARQNERHREHNAAQSSAMRTSVKSIHKLLETDPAKAKASFPKAASLLDQAARLGLIHANKAARLKSRLNKKLKAKA